MLFRSTYHFHDSALHEAIEEIHLLTTRYPASGWMISDRIHYIASAICAAASQPVYDGPWSLHMLPHTRRSPEMIKICRRMSDTIRRLFPFHIEGAHK